MTDLCISFEAALDVLDWDKPSAYGVSTDCIAKCSCSTKSCNRVWCKSERDTFFGALRAAQDRISKYIDLCDDEQQRTKINPAHCPVYLNKKITSLGVKVFIDLGTFDTILSKRNVPCFGNWTQVAPQCVDDYEIFVFIPAPLPEGVTPEQLIFKYSPVDCRNTRQCLEQPCIQFVSCNIDNQVILDGVVVLDANGDPLVCSEDCVDGYLATWPKHQLASPYANDVALNGSDGFIETVDVCYYEIDTEQALEVPPTCFCHHCNGQQPDIEYTVTTGDLDCGEVCIQGSKCKCVKQHYVYLNYLIETKEPDYDLTRAIAVLALDIIGPESACLSCSDAFKSGRWLQNAIEELGPSERYKDYIFGTSRAGIYAWQAVNACLGNAPTQTISFSSVSV